MPSLPSPIETTEIMLNYRSKQYDLDHAWNTACWYWLNNYNWNGIGGMPDYDYIVPDGSGIKITYKAGNGEIYVDGNSWSGQSPDQRQLFRTYERQFIREGLRKYSEVYGI